MEVNKVERSVDGQVETLIDLTADTVTPESLMLGAAAHNAAGVRITGIADFGIPSSSTTSPLTDSADGMVQRLTVYGSSEVTENSIKSVGDDGLTVTTANSDDTLITFANFTTALPLRGVGDTVRDKLICTADSKQVETVCGEVDLRTLVWTERATNNGKKAFSATLPQNYIGVGNLPLNWISTPLAYCFNTNGYNLENVPLSSYNVGVYGYTTNGETNLIYAVTLDTESPTGTLIYELAEPVTTPLTDAEISAFRGLRTYDSTTNITITDEPEFSIDYLRNTENGQTVADIQTGLQGQISSGEIKTLTYTGTGTTTNNIVFPVKPLIIYSIASTNKTNTSIVTIPFPYGQNRIFIAWEQNGSFKNWYVSSLSYSADEMTMTVQGTDKGAALNDETTDYIICYV